MPDANPHTPTPDSQFRGLAVNIAGIHLKNPVMTASGTFGYGEEFASLVNLNRLGGIIVTGLFTTFGTFLMRQFMESIPFELLDAARIDGASEWRIYFTLVLPMSMSPMSALAVIVFLGNWDSFLWPLIVLNSRDKQTLPLVLDSLRNLWWTSYEVWSAGSMLTVLPIMILYGFASRYFLRGIAMTGIKA